MSPIPIPLLILGGASAAKLGYSVNKSVKMDEKALAKYAKAFSKSEEANQMIREKAELTDKRLVNVAKKKKAIIEISVPKFVEVYSKIQQIQLEGKTNINEIALKKSIENLKVLSSPSISMKREFTDKELVCGLLTKGFNKMIIKDSERYVSAANKQMSAANVAYSYAESICEVYDAIIQRADRIAKVLSILNALFMKSINETAKVIDKNGLSVRNYDEYEKGVLMTCVNIASALSDIIDIPVIDEDGEIAEAGYEMLQKGENFLTEMNQMI